MARTIKLTIRGRGADTDAPTVDDLLDQVRDYFDIIESVEGAVAGDAGTAIEWRVVSATTNSPLAIEAAAFPRTFATNIDRRAELTIRNTAVGLAALQSGASRPAYFTDAALAKAQKFFERVSNGLDLTVVDHGPGLPQVTITPPEARAATINIKSVLAPVAKPYKELGSVEGYIKSVESYAWRHPILRIQHRLSGDEVKCFVRGEALQQVRSLEVKEVWNRRRVLVFGTVFYKSVGRIERVDVTQVRFLRERRDLPKVEDILDTDFTHGLRTEDYLERLRNGDH